MKTSALRLQVLLAVLTLAAARIPSIGLTTTQGIREALPDSAFRVSFNDLTTVTLPGVQFEVATLSNTPALAGADVQFTSARIRFDYNATFPMHYHPRAAELITVLEGRMRITFRAEGLFDNREVTNVFRPTDVAIIPTGFIHEVTCVARNGCLIVNGLNSADPGIVGV